jgi:lipocalin-like protein
MRRLLALLLLTAISGTACGGDSGTNPTPASLAGTWNLSTINGAPLPFVLQAVGPKIEVLSDQIVAAAGGTFTETGSGRVTDAGVVTIVPITDSGTWTISGATVTFRFDSDGFIGTATLSGNTFTVAVGAVSQVYVKQ